MHFDINDLMLIITRLIEFLLKLNFHNRFTATTNNNYIYVFIDIIITYHKENK